MYGIFLSRLRWQPHPDSRRCHSRLLGYRCHRRRRRSQADSACWLYHSYNSLHRHRFAYEPLKHSHNGLLALYVLGQLFFNCGPNATTFIVPCECFPSRYRSTSHDISAASGKIGAIIAQCVVGPLVHRGAKKHDESPWLNHVMQIFALFMFGDILTSFLIPETKRRTLEDLGGGDYGIMRNPNGGDTGLCVTPTVEMRRGRMKGTGTKSLP